ncbi:MAG: M1 family aminopeptidase [Kofleriaceae bacterium]
MRRQLVGCGLVLVACGGDAAPPSGPIAAMVTHYDYRFDIESRAAHATVTGVVDTAGDCWTLPFRAQDFNAATPTIDGQPVNSGTLDASALTLCGDSHDAGETITVDVDMVIPLQTVGPSQVGYSLTMDTDDNPFYYLVSWVGGCDQFGPCDSRADQFATYTFHVTHPEPLKVTCPGTITEVSATETQCVFDLPGGPTYSTFGVAAYPTTAWVPIDKGMWGSVHVTLYDRAGTNIDAAVDPTHHAGFMTWMESQFGAYPYGTELRVLTAPTYWSGFEHPGNILIDDRLAKGMSTGYLHRVQHTLDHEIAHMWAGDETTLADTYDFVWKEAMAEYLSFVYEAMVEPPAAHATLGVWKGSAPGVMYHPIPDERPPLFDFYGDCYGPGPMILFRQVEVMSSRDQVLAALKTLLGSPRAISVADVIDALEASTGLELTEYAAAWLKGTGAPVWPTFNIQFSPDVPKLGTSTLGVQQVMAQPKRCKFHVALRGADAEDRVLVEIDTFNGGLSQQIEVPTPPFTVTATEIDPDRECLAFPGIVARTERVNPWLSERGRAAERAAVD